MAGLGSTGPQLVGAQHWQIKNSSVPSWSAKADHPRVLLFMQFGQDGRGPLLATVLTLVILLFILYRTHFKKLVGIMAAMIIVIGVFTNNSNNFHERVSQFQSDIELIEQEVYGTSGGYRLAMWDVGLHAITQRPWFGYGTGMAASAFEQTSETHKGGRYKSLANYQKNMHYHNDWIE
ncbi:MAG: O-antigen ligase family protein, partial [Rhodospirillaceae bacterium]|nr:O-antigen ligase family protein [Rhodospirillaceae bacterium]